MKGHTTFVNSCQIARRGPQLICSGSDDGTIKVCNICKQRKNELISTTLIYQFKTWGINLNNHCGIRKIHGGLSFVDYVGIPHTQINILKEF